MGETVLMLDPAQRAQQENDFALELAHFGKNAKDEICGWGEFLPCSLEPEPFIKAHHQALFRRQHFGYDVTKLQRAVDTFNQIGIERRKVFEASRGKRPFVFSHLMFRQDLEAIAIGRGVYEHISRSVRTECFVSLHDELTQDPKVKLFLSSREELRTTLFPTIDSLVLIDRAVAFWRLQTGQICWTEDHDMIASKRAVLDTFLSNSTPYTATALYEDFLKP